MPNRLIRVLPPLIVVLLAGLSTPAAPKLGEPAPPNVLLITVDTLRADRVSALGYGRETSPNIDALMAQGVNFFDARTVEPLTNPSMSSMLTSRMPHRHGATRNGLRVRPGLSSLPKQLAEHGYRTAAFVGNWTLRDKLSGLAEHFDTYEEVLTRARWFGLVRSEATGEDLVDRSVAWIREHHEDEERPFLAWVHFVEPHAPYRLQKDHVEVLGAKKRGGWTKSDRYDTEIAYVDAAIGDLLERIERYSPASRTLVVFASDHGESLGEHSYWGHGRNLYEQGLRIPMALRWTGQVEPRVIRAPATQLDLAPTVLSLLGLPGDLEFDGYDWTHVLRGADEPMSRLTTYETHKGAVISNHKSDLARRSGLLEIALLRDGVKQVFRIDKNRHFVYDLNRDPAERDGVAHRTPEPSEALLTYMRLVYEGLLSHEDLEVAPLDEESIAALRSLGYVD